MLLIQLIGIINIRNVSGKFAMFLQVYLEIQREYVCV